jgi:hypothetical protein
MFVLAIFVPVATSKTMMIRSLSSGYTVAFSWHIDVGTLVDGD